MAKRSQAAGDRFSGPLFFCGGGVVFVAVGFGLVCLFDCLLFFWFVCVFLLTLLVFPTR